jgi:WD40 repeat protein/tetratricopeptide (TPR) repeat protein
VYRGQARRIGEQNTQIRGALFDALVAQARATRFSRRPGQRFDSLEALRKAAEGGIATGAAGDTVRRPLSADEIARLRDETIASLALPDLEPTGRAIEKPPGFVIFAADPIMTRYALRFVDGTISIRRLEDDRELARFPARGDRDFAVFEFSPDGRYLASGERTGPALKVWDVDRRALAVDDPGPVGHQLAWSPDGRRLLLIRRGTLLEYDLATGRSVRTWPGAAGHVAFRPDGARLAVIDADPRRQTCRIHEADSGQLVRAIALETTAEWVAWSPDGRTLAIARPDHRIDLRDAETGSRRASLEGLTSGAPTAAFHPAGTLLASNGWEGRLRLWDPILGRPLLTLNDNSDPARFARDGRIVVSSPGRLTVYRVDPARGYRTFAHASGEPMDYQRASIHPGGRLLVVGTDHGAILWDLARGAELAFLAIGGSPNAMFEPSGDLLTGGTAGVQRWPIRLDPARGAFRIGPPRRLPFPNSACQVGEDRSGRIVAQANHGYAQVVTPGGTFRLGPLDDCRGVAVSPDGRWLATGSHVRGAQVWSVADGTKVAELPTESSTAVAFSPDGEWLMAAGGRLWEVGTWREARRIDGGDAFSPDGRIVAAVDPGRVIRLVEVATGRTLARLESPDLCGVYTLAFGPDGSRLVVVTNDGPAAHVWDLRAIRKDLADRGLDWDAPAYPEPDPADPSAAPLPAPEVDYGPLAGHLEHFREAPEALVRRYTERLRADPGDADAFHHRSHALANLRRFPEAIDDLTRAIERWPSDAHLRSTRAWLAEYLGRYEPAIADLESALAARPEADELRERLAMCCNNLAWQLAAAPGRRGDLGRALDLAGRARDLAPGQGESLNTMGVLLYRAGRYAEAVAMLERSRTAHRGRYDGFDLFFLAMVRHRLGRRDEARADFDRAARWVGEQKGLDEPHARELAAFRAEAESVLAGPAGELPEEVFAPGR